MKVYSKRPAPSTRLDRGPDLPGMAMPFLPAGSLPFTGERIPEPAPATPKPPRKSLLEKYKPERLGDVLGQADVVRVLQKYAADPFPAGLILAGPTGTGKSATAEALAADLGVLTRFGELAGYHLVRSTDQSIDALRTIVDERLSYSVMVGSGWRVVQLEGADRMNQFCEEFWLTMLDPKHIRPRTTFVFTTNHPDKLSARFRSRCIQLEFRGKGPAVESACKDLCRKVWASEGGTGEWPNVGDSGIYIDGNVSFRQALQGIQTALLKS